MQIACSRGRRASAKGEREHSDPLVNQTTHQPIHRPPCPATLPGVGPESSTDSIESPTRLPCPLPSSRVHAIAQELAEARKGGGANWRAARAIASAAPTASPWRARASACVSVRARRASSQRAGAPDSVCEGVCVSRVCVHAGARARTLQCETRARARVTSIVLKDDVCFLVLRQRQTRARHAECRAMLSRTAAGRCDESGGHMRRVG
eukprot:5293132-Pleurochrysis_carterae.AAC.2